MSESEYVFTVFKRYWKTLVKWLLHITGLPEITVDNLLDRINSDQPPLLIDVRSPAKFNGGYGHIQNTRSI